MLAWPLRYSQEQQTRRYCELIAPTANYPNCLNGSYPLARFLYVYVNKSPSKDMDKLTSEFMTFVLSKQGQEIVIKDGYFPLPADAAAEGRASLKFYSAE